MEVLYRKMTYEWLPFKEIERSEIEKVISKISYSFGNEYKLTFY